MRPRLFAWSDLAALRKPRRKSWKGSSELLRVVAMQTPKRVSWEESPYVYDSMQIICERLLMVIGAGAIVFSYVEERACTRLGTSFPVRSWLCSQLTHIRYYYCRGVQRYLLGLCMHSTPAQLYIGMIRGLSPRFNICFSFGTSSTV